MLMHRNNLCYFWSQLHLPCLLHLSIPSVLLRHCHLCYWDLRTYIQYGYGSKCDISYKFLTHCEYGCWFELKCRCRDVGWTGLHVLLIFTRDQWLKWLGQIFSGSHDFLANLIGFWYSLELENLGTCILIYIAYIFAQYVM